MDGCDGSRETPSLISAVKTGDEASYWCGGRPCLDFLMILLILLAISVSPPAGLPSRFAAVFHRHSGCPGRIFRLQDGFAFRILDRPLVDALSEAVLPTRGRLSWSYQKYPVVDDDNTFDDGAATTDGDLSLIARPCEGLDSTTDRPFKARFERVGPLGLESPFATRACCAKAPSPCDNDRRMAKSTHRGRRNSRTMRNLQRR